MIYLDTSAFFKTVRKEPESLALGTYLSAITSPEYVSSTLLSVEARRSALRNDPALLPRTDLALGRVQQIEMSAAVLESAGRLPDPLLRALDAIHLATAPLISDDLDVLISYDQRMIAAATAFGLPTACPA